VWRSSEDRSSRTKEARRTSSCQENQAGLRTHQRHCHCHVETVHHFLAVHKEQSESHKLSPFLLFIKSFSPTNKHHFKFRKLPESQFSRNAKSTNNSRQYQATSARGALLRKQLSQYHYK
jgi:hypothetical protein